MKLPRLLALTYTALLFTTSCQKDNYYEILEDDNTLENDVRSSIETITGNLEGLILPESNDFAKIPSDPNNPITQEKIMLGQLLFHETAIGVTNKFGKGNKTYSCASCHHVAAGFQSGMKQGIGEGGIGFGNIGETRRADPAYPVSDIDVQPIKSPSILNVAYQEVMLWNGQFGATGLNEGTENQWTPGTPKAVNELGFQGVETQAIAGMGVHRLDIDDSLLTTTYKSYFDSAFPNTSTEERYTLQNAGLAIAAYERTVLSNEAPFQQFLKGDNDIMSASELRGAQLFFGKANCYSCHSGPNLAAMDFYAIGMNDLSGEDIIGEVDEATRKGRGGFTKTKKMITNSRCRNCII